MEFSIGMKMVLHNHTVRTRIIGPYARTLQLPLLVCLVFPPPRLRGQIFGVFLLLFGGEIFGLKARPLEFSRLSLRFTSPGFGNVPR